MITTRTAESAIRLSSLTAVSRAPASEASEVQEEVLALFDQFRDPLLRYVCACGMAVGDGEDVVQDVFLALFQHLRGGGSRTNLRGWLFRVAHNLTLKRRARQRREAARVGGDLRIAFSMIDAGPNPEENLVDRQRRTRLLRVLNALPTRDQQCLHLRGEGLRYRDIARVLGISLGAVAKSVAGGVGRLARADEG